MSLDQIQFSGAAQGWEPSHDGARGVFSCDLSQKPRAEFVVSITSTSNDESQISVDVAEFANIRQQQSDAEVAKNKAETAAADATNAVNAIQTSHESEKLQNAKDIRDAANAKKTMCENEATRLDNLTKEWRSKYDSLSYRFPLSLRLPNGVEVMQVEISLPKLSP